jgi:hypothetical protein
MLQELTDLKSFLENPTETRFRLRPPEMHPEANSGLSAIR